MSLRRSMMRWQVRNGKLSLKAYRATLRRVDVGAKDDEVNAPRRRWAWMVRAEIKRDDRHDPTVRTLQNMLRQMRLVEVQYHPTKGYRFRRGEPIEERP